MEKNKVVKKVVTFLKRNVNWRPYDKTFNLHKEYSGEPYMLLTGRDNLNSSVVEFLHFVDADTAKAMLRFSCAFRNILVDLTNMSIIEEQNKCICSIPRKGQESKVKCHYCKKAGACGYWFCGK